MALTAIAAEGWKGTYGSPPTFAPDTAPITFSAARNGYTATAGTGNTTSATTYAETFTITRRVREPAPNDAVLTADTVAFSDFVYASDVITGVTNNSTLISPKPIGKHRLAPRRMVDSAVNQLPVAVSVDHRDGIAAVVFSVTDGTTTLTQTVVTPVWSNKTGDQGAVIEYQHTFDTTTLTAGRLTINYKVYPRIGQAASVLDSADQTIETRTFCNQYVVKGPIYYVYVGDGGAGTSATKTNAAGGAAVSTSAATAAAGIGATDYNVAIARARALMPSNRTSGLRVRLRGATTATAVDFNTYQDQLTSGEVVLERDPLISKAAATFTYSAVTNVYHPFFRFHGLTLVRTGNVAIGGNLGISGHVAFSDCDWNAGGFAAGIIGQAHWWEGNHTISNLAAGTLMTAGLCHLLRGAVVGALGGTTNQIDDWNVAGCDIKNGWLLANAQPENMGGIEGTIIRTNASTGSGGLFVAGTTGTPVTGYMIRNVVEEYYGAVANTGMRMSADGQGGDTTHMVIRGLTIAGANNASRFNLGYDESPTTSRRAHSLWRVEGLLATQINNKSDRFVHYTQANADAPNRVGAWPVMFGVGWQGTFTIYPDAGGGATGSDQFRQEYPGLGADIAVNNTAPQDPLFTTSLATTWNGTAYSAGTGGGLYSIGPTSPARALVVPTAGTPIVDIAGLARRNSGTGAAGAYERTDAAAVAITPNPLAFAATLSTPALRAAVRLAPVAASFGLTVTTPALRAARRVAPSAASFSLQVSPTTLSGPGAVTPSGSMLGLTITAATLRVTRTLSPATMLLTPDLSIASIGGSVVLAPSPMTLAGFVTSPAISGNVPSAGVVEFRAIFPAFAAVPDAAISFWLTRAARVVDGGWTEGDRVFAQMMLAAHLMTQQGLGTGAEAAAAAAGAAGFKSMRSGALSLDRGTDAATSGYGTTSYGRQFLELLLQNRSGALVTGTGCIVEGAGYYGAGRLPGW